MRLRQISNPLIITVFIGTVLWGFSYGPARREFVEPARAVAVHSAQELDQLWHSSGVRGRVAVIFSRHIDQQFSGGQFPEMDYIETAMKHGLVRKVYYLVPDRAWSEVVSENLMGRNLVVPVRTTDRGFIILRDGGRIHCIPLTKFVPESDEKVLAVLDQESWSPEELLRIDKLFASGLVSTDLMVTVSRGK